MGMTGRAVSMACGSATALSYLSRRTASRRGLVTASTGARGNRALHEATLACLHTRPRDLNHRVRVSHATAAHRQPS